MKLPQRLLREPLLHFLAIGGLIFLVFAAVDDNRETPADVIVIGPERIKQLAAEFESVWKRMPVGDDLEAMIEWEVREEVYYREALALGLDRNDAIVRRRLRLKMEFLIDTGATLVEPVADELETYYAANAQKYRIEPRLAFEQIYLGEAPSPESIAQSLSALQSDPITSSSTLGKRTLLPAQLGLSPPNTIDAVFGKGFFGRLANLRLEEWTGPAASSFGVHLVRILDSAPGRTPPLAQVRAAVLRDWKAAKAQEIRDQDYAKRRKRFVVEIRRGDEQAALGR